MSKYTIQLRTICETQAGLLESKGFNDIEDILEKCVDKIFSFNWKYYDDSKKRDFEKDFLRYFYMEEICTETYGEWKLYLQSWLHVNMPYWNEQLKSVSLNIDPLDEYDFSRVTTDSGTDTSTQNVTQTNTQTTDSTTTENGDAWELYQNTPQGGLTGVKENNYLTTATNNTADNSTTEHGESNESIKTDSNGTYGRENTQNVKESGRRRPPAELIIKYQEAMKNVYGLIFKDMESLFFGLWS